MDFDQSSSLFEPVMSVWRETLGLDNLGTDEDFFDLGGNSLLAWMIAAELKDRLDIETDFSAILQYSTVRSFVQYLEEQRVSI